MGSYPVYSTRPSRSGRLSPFRGNIGWRLMGRRFHAILIQDGSRHNAVEQEGTRWLTRRVHYLKSAHLRADDAMLSRILPQSLRLGMWICQRNVAIRPDEIERSAHKAGLLHALLPAEWMEREVKVLADFGQTPSRLAIYVDLPSEGREWGEIVVSVIGFYPGQSVARPNTPGGALAQGTIAIVHPDLRYGVEQESLHRSQAEQPGNDQGNYPCSDPSGETALPGDECEYAIGRGNQSPRKCHAFRFIRCQQTVVGAAVQHGSKLPGQVSSISNPGIHSLSADRAMDMRRVSQ